MSNVIEFVKGDRKVLVSQDKLALTGAVLGSLAGKSNGVSRFGVLKDRRVFAVLEAAKVRDEVKQVQEITNTFKTLEGKGIITLSGDKVQTAAITSDFAELAAEVTEAAGKVELSAPATAKRGRPAGSGGKSQGSASVKRNPKQGKRFWLSGGKVLPFGVGKPSKDKLLAECDEKGKNIADVAAINARFAAKEAKSMSVKRNPVQKANLRYYMLDGKVTPFGRGKPGIEKLNNECTQAGEKIDNSERVAAMRQPKSGGGNSSKVNALEAQIAQMQEMMAKMLAAMTVGAVAMPAAAVAAEVPAKTAEKTVEAPKPAKVKAETPKAEKPVKSKASKPKSDKPAKPAKAEKASRSEEIDEDEAYSNFAKISDDLGDDEPIAFGSDGFVVTEID